MKTKLLVLFFLSSIQFGMTQDGSSGDTNSQSLKIAYLQSTKVANKGALYTRASLILGSTNNENNSEAFFDENGVNAELQIIYGLLDGLQVGISREIFRKTFAGHLKYSLAEQNSNFPLALTVYSIINLNSQLKESQYPNLKYGDRLSYATQLLISRKMGNRLTLTIAPTFVRQNLVFEKEQDHEQYALGIGFSYSITEQWTINLDYVYNMSRWENSIYSDPLSIGIDFKTGGYLFQMLLTNSQTVNEPGFISNSEGDWNEGYLFLGFNVAKVF